MKNQYSYREIGLLLIALSAVSGCAPKPPVSATGLGIEKTLKQAEQDARSGNQAKALKEIDDAEKGLISEDKAHPIPQQSKTWSGEDAKATSEKDAIKELNRARADVKKSKTIDAADEIENALKDVEVKEGN